MVGFLTSMTSRSTEMICQLSVENAMERRMIEERANKEANERVTAVQNAILALCFQPPLFYDN